MFKPVILSFWVFLSITNETNPVLIEVFSKLLDLQKRFEEIIMSS